MKFKFDSQVIIHYALYPRNSKEPTFIEIYSKRLDYDDFGSWIHFGSKLVQDAVNYELEMEVENISMNEDLIFKAYAVDREGQISETFKKKLSTSNIYDPFAILIELRD